MIYLEDFQKKIKSDILSIKLFHFPNNCKLAKLKFLYKRF